MSLKTEEHTHPLHPLLQELNDAAWDAPEFPQPGSRQKVTPGVSMDAWARQ